jgi:hypothetical protein
VDVRDSTTAPSEGERGYTAVEEAFFEKGALEERASQEAWSKAGRRRPASRWRSRLRAGLGLLGTLALGAFTFRVLEPAPRPAEPPAVAVRASAPVAAAVAPPPPRQPPVVQAPPAAARAPVPAPALAAAPADDGRDAAARALRVAKTELDHGRTASALTWARRAVTGDPRLAEGYVIIGSAEQAAGRRSAAREAYARYLALAPHGRYASELRAITRAW